jgi:ATP-dependent DNA helicase PIF1
LSEKSKSLLQSRVGANLRNDRGIVPTKLFTRKMSVNRLNDEELDKLAAIGRPFFEYELSFMVLDATSGAKSNDILMEKFKDNTTCLPTLQLCVGAQVMLLVNLDLRNKLANGSRGVVIGFESELPKVRFLSGEDVVVDYHNWEIEDGKGNTVIIARQIPLKPAYAITVHHSQGMTLDCAEMDLSNVFEFSQTYVALSRVKSLEGLRLTAIDFDLIKAHPKALEYYNKLENKLINEAAAAATV